MTRNSNGRVEFGLREWIGIFGILLAHIVTLFVFGASMHSKLSVMENELGNLQGQIMRLETVVEKIRG